MILYHHSILIIGFNHEIKSYENSIYHYLKILIKDYYFFTDGFPYGSPVETSSAVLSMTTSMSYDDQPLAKPNFEIGERTSLVHTTSLPPISILSMASEDSLTNREIADLTARSQMYFGAKSNQEKENHFFSRARANSLSSTYDEHSKRLRNSMTTTTTFANKYNQLWKQNGKVGSLSSFASKCEDLIPNIPSTLNRNFWNRFTMSKSCTNLNDVDLVQDDNEINDIKNNDYIPSPTLFDHIETFSFDDVLTTSSSKNSSPSTSVKKAHTNNNNNINCINKMDSNNSSTKSKQQTKADLKQFSNLLEHKISSQLESRKNLQNSRKTVKPVQTTKSINEKNALSQSRPKTKTLKKKKTLHERRMENHLVNRSMLGGDMYISVTKKPVIKRPKVKLRESYFNDGRYSLHDDTVKSYGDNNSLNSSGNESLSSSGNDSLGTSENDSVGFTRNDSFGSSTKDSLQTSEPSTPDLIQTSMDFTPEIHSFRPIARCELTINV